MGLLLAAIWPTLIMAGLGFLLVGAGVSCVVPLVISLATQSSPAHTGSVVTAVSTIAYLGFLIVPPVVGFLAETLNLRWSFGLMALSGGFIIWLVTKIK
jgi:MFS family permease